MNRKISFSLMTLAALAIGALLLLPGTGSARATTTVKVGDDFFSPASKSISTGTKVRFKWVNTSNDHNVTKKSGPGRSFASETTAAPGVQYQKTFKKAGTYRLICTVHPDDMKLKLNVG